MLSVFFGRRSGHPLTGRELVRSEDEGKKKEGPCTFTHAFADSALEKRTLAIPSISLSYRTTLVTSPSLEHSSRMSSLISRMAAGSSCLDFLVFLFEMQEVGFVYLELL